MSDPTYRLIYDSTQVISLAPAVGTTYPPKGQTVFDGTEAACQSQITALNLAPLPDPALAPAKAAKLAALAKAFALPVTVSGISLATDDRTQILLGHFIVALQLALSQQPDAAHVSALTAANISTLIGPLVDSAGAPHDMTVGQGLTLMLGYVQAYGAARAAYLANVAAVNAADTVAAVAAVDAVAVPAAAS